MLNKKDKQKKNTKKKHEKKHDNMWTINEINNNNNTINK